MVTKRAANSSTATPTKAVQSRGPPRDVHSRALSRHGPEQPRAPTFRAVATPDEVASSTRPTAPARTYAALTATCQAAEAQLDPPPAGRNHMGADVEDHGQHPQHRGPATPTAYMRAGTTQTQWWVQEIGDASRPPTARASMAPTSSASLRQSPGRPRRRDERPRPPLTAHSQSRGTLVTRGVHDHTLGGTGSRTWRVPAEARGLVEVLEPVAADEAGASSQPTVTVPTNAPIERATAHQSRLSR